MAWDNPFSILPINIPLIETNIYIFLLCLVESVIIS